MMNDFLDAFAPGDIARLLIDVGLKGFVIVGLAMGLYLILRNRSAALRHLVLTLSCIGLVSLPWLSAMLPSWQVPMGPLRSEASTEPDEVANDTKESTAGPRARGLGSEASTRSSHATANEENIAQLGSAGKVDVQQQDAVQQDDEFASDSVARPEPATKVSSPVAASQSAVSHSLPATSSQSEPNPTQPVAYNLARFIPHAWLLGAAFSLLMPLVGLLGLAHHCRKCRTITDKAWLALLHSVKSELGISRRVYLLRSPNIETALTWSVFKPKLLLPAAAENWTESQRRAVLLHELAHIQRFDWAVQMTTHLACAIHWFNPLVWWMSRQMYLDREQASDDVVLSAGVSPVDYASQLFEIATRIRPFQSLAAIPMAQQSTLRRRVSAVLDTQRPRGSIHRIALVAAIIVCCCVVVPVAMLKASTDDSVAKVTDADPYRSNESNAAKQGRNTPSLNDGTNEKDVSEKSPTNRKRADHAAKKTEKIRVVNGDTGEGIAGAMISFDPDAKASKLNFYDESLTSVAYTDERGEIELPSNTLEFLQLRVTHSEFLRSRFAQPSAVLGGALMLVKTPWPYGTIDGQKIIRLWRGQTVRGTIRFFDGKPIANLKLKFAAKVNDKEWLKKTGETIWTMQQEHDWESSAITDKHGAFAAAVPPRTKRDELNLWSASELAAPFRRPIEANELGTIEIERGTIVRGIMRDLDGNPKVKTLVSIDRDTAGGDEARPEMTRTTYTDDAGRYELPLAASGPSVLRGFGCLPQRLGLMRDQREHVVDLQIAPYYDIKFEVSDTRQNNPGAHNLRLQGEIASTDGGRTIPYSGYLFYNRHERTITIRVPRVLRNARLYMHNYQQQVVHISDESGENFPASAKPIKIPDLSALPKLKVWLRTGAPLYVGVLEANGTVPKNVKVSGVAEGEFGSRNLGEFRQQGKQWVSPGLYVGERVELVVERSNESLHRATADPIRLEATNAIELRLSAAQSDESSEDAVNADTPAVRDRVDESAGPAKSRVDGDDVGEATEANSPQVGLVNVSPDKAAAYLRAKKGVTVGEAVERDRITWKSLGKLIYPDVTLKRDWVPNPKDWQYIANLARVTNGFREPHNVRIVIEGHVEADALAECFEAFRKSKNNSFELVISRAPLNQKALRVLGSYPGLTGLMAELSTDDVTDEDWAACISGWPNAFRLFLAPSAGKKAVAAASKLGNLNTLVLRNTTLTEAELEPLRKSRNVEALLVGDKNTQIEYLLPGGFGKWQSGDAGKEPASKETSFSDEKDPVWQVNSPLNKHNLNKILFNRRKFTASDLEEFLGPANSIEVDNERGSGWTFMNWEDVSRIEVTFRDKVVVKVSGTFSPRLKSQVINKDILGQLRTGMAYNDIYKNVFLGCKAESRQDVDASTITHTFEQYNRFRVGLKDGKARTATQICFQNRDGPPVEVP